MSKLWSMVLSLAAVAVLASPVTCAEPAKAGFGEGEGLFRPIELPALPTLSLSDADLTKQERDYLGLEKKGGFTVRDVKADLVFLEYLNVYCAACNMQAPVLDNVYKKIQARPDLKDRVRFLGVAAGNGTKEVASFRQRFSIPYPIVPDLEFSAYDGIGNPGGTPFMIMYAPNGKGGKTVVRAQLGLIKDPNVFIGAMEVALGLKGEEKEPAYIDFTSGAWRNLKPAMTDAAIAERLKASAAEAGLKDAKVEPVTVGTEPFYRLTAGGKQLWARLAGRAKICNVCHDLFFIILFDDTGKIVNYSSIHVTKLNNVDWDEKDNEAMRKRLVGRRLGDPVVFNNEVDAVSTATMSSALIYDTIRRLSDSYKTMTEKGIIKK